MFTIAITKITFIDGKYFWSPGLMNVLPRAARRGAARSTMGRSGPPDKHVSARSGNRSLLINTAMAITNVLFSLSGSWFVMSKEKKKTFDSVARLRLWRPSSARF